MVSQPMRLTRKCKCITAEIALHRTICAALVAAIAIIGAIAVSTAAHATTYTVNTLDDSSGNRDCSLRDAINAAEGSPTAGSTCTTPGSGNDTIQFKVSGTITLGSTLLIFNGAGPSLTINGSGRNIIISGNNEVLPLLVFGLTSAITLNLQNLTIANGDNGLGGGIFNDGGTVTVTNSTFSNNNASLFQNAGNGGAINNIAGTVTVTNSTFSNNSSNDSGGAIYNIAGTVAVINSTFSGNSAGALGGAIYSDLRSPVTVTNSTFSNNSAGDVGGAIFNNGFGNTLIVTNSTFSGNSAAAGAGFGGAIWGTANLKGTILAASSSGGNCAGGSLSDQGYNLSDDGSCGFSAIGSQNNVSDTQLNLGPLQNNGGPTQTIALGAASVAIDAIPLADCTDQASPPKRLITDQRGALRPDVGELLCDIGAYEFQDLAGQPNCHDQSTSALAHQFGSIKAAASALGFANLQALQNAITISCGG